MEIILVRKLKSKTYSTKNIPTDLLEFGVSTIEAKFRTVGNLDDNYKKGCVNITEIHQLKVLLTFHENPHKNE